MPSERDGHLAVDPPIRLPRSGAQSRNDVAISEERLHEKTIAPALIYDNAESIQRKVDSPLLASYERLSLAPGVVGGGEVVGRASVVFLVAGVVSDFWVVVLLGLAVVVVVCTLRWVV